MHVVLLAEKNELACRHVIPYPQKMMHSLPEGVQVELRDSLRVELKRIEIVLFQVAAIASRFPVLPPRVPDAKEDRRLKIPARTFKAKSPPTMAARSMRFDGGSTI